MANQKPNLQKKVVNPKKRIEFSENSIPDFLKKTWIYFLALFILVFIFFWGGIFGNGFSASDTVASLSFKPYLEQAKQNGTFPLWIPYIFGGMPSFGSLLVTGARNWDFTSQIYFGIIEFIGKIFGSDEARVAFHYVIYAIGVFLLMRMKKQNHLVSFFTSLAAVFSTGIVIWIMIGHNTKPVVFSMFPWIFLFMEKLIKKFSLLYAVLIVFAVHIMLEATHVQMIFYGGLAFGLYLVYEFIIRLIKKENFASVLKPAMVLIVAFGLSFLLSADRYLSIQEYTPYSTRGSAPLLAEKGAKQTKDGGNDYEYATQWSFSPGEVFTFFVPNYFGFGKMSYSGPETNGQETMIPTYWGQKPFEDAAPYFGIIILFFGIVGAIAFRKDVFVQFLIFISLFALLLSFGYTMPIIFDIFYYHFPMFNKFRAPSMALAIVHFAMPILAGYGLAAFIKWNKEDSVSGKKITKYLLYSSIGFFVLGLLFIAAFQGSYIDAIKASQSFRLPENFQEFVWSAMVSDWMINSVVVILASLLAYFFVNRKLKFMVMISGLIILLIFDLWRVGYRPMEIPEQKLAEQVFPKDDAFDYVKQDKEVFRVADFASQSPNVTAYYLLQNVNGYHSAKLRVFQDILDATSQKSTSNVTSPFIWNLMNVKYIFAKQEMGAQPIYKSNATGTMVYFNPEYLPRAFFVDTVISSEPKNILKHLSDKDFNPHTTAFLEKSINLNYTVSDSNDFAKVTKYQDELINMNVKVNQTKLLVLSEVFYPDWVATIDGKEFEIIKVNYFMRGLIIPAGEHKIEMKFISKSFEKGKTLSLSANIILAILLAISLFFELKNNKKNISENENS